MAVPRQSRESSRPILTTKGTSTGVPHRLPFHSKTASDNTRSIQTSPSFSTNSSSSLDPRLADMKILTNSLDRLENKRLQEQRYDLSPQKENAMNLLALSARVERALGRRYSSQDAELKVKPKFLSEKVGA